MMRWPVFVVVTFCVLVAFVILSSLLLHAGENGANAVHAAEFPFLELFALWQSSETSHNLERIHDAVRYSSRRLRTRTGGANCLVLGTSPLQMPTGASTVVVFVHGFPDTALTFSAQMLALAKRGITSWSIALPGYDVECVPPHDDYSLPALAAHVLDVIEELRLPTPPHLVGHDWGAVIAQACAASSPGKIESLTSLAIPPLRRFLSTALASPFFFAQQLARSWYMLFFQLPWLPELWLSASGGVKQLWSAWSATRTANSAGAIDVHMRVASSLLASSGDARILSGALQFYRQIIPTLLGAFLGAPVMRSHHLAAQSSIRLQTSAPQTDAEYLAWILGAVDADALRVSSMWILGADDGCVCADVFRASVHAIDFAHTILVHTIERAGHWMHLEDGDRVTALLLEFFSFHHSIRANESRGH